MIYNAQIKVNIQSYGTTEIYYSYNDNTDFQDLLEYIAYLIPNANICQCSKFKYINNNVNNHFNFFNYSDIRLDEKLMYFQSHFSNLYLSKINIICNCNSKYLKSSKYLIYQNFMDQYNNLKKKNNLNEQKISSLEKEKKDNINKLEDLQRQNAYQNNQISNLQKENKKQIDNLNSLEGKINNLDKEREILEMAVNGDQDKIAFLNQFGIVGGNLKMKDNIIKIDPKTNQIIGNEKNSKTNFMDFYDVIVHINSIKDINKGWKIEMSQKGKENYEKYKNNKIIKIGVIGNSNKGKSFLLSKISKIDLPSGTSIRTEGLSIKSPDLDTFKDRKIALLDSAGLETPVLKIDKNIQEDKIKEYFKEKSREKLITELFLQNYIINNSDVLIAVVGILTYSEQKLLMKIKKEIERSKINIPLFIIHNLITYTSVEQVNDYIREFLLNSATFTLEEGHKVSTSTQSKSGRYFHEENKDQKIYHLIFANEGSEAGKYFNQFTLDFLENNYQTVTHLVSFDVIETIKDRFIKLSKDIIEKANTDEKKFNNESFDTTNLDSIKLKDAKEIVLKKCLTDELGFSNLKANGFEPTYNLYKKENKIILRIEASGNTNLDPPEIEFAGEYNIIKIKGVKKKDKEPANKDKNDDGNIFNTREHGEFSFEVPLKTEDYLLSNEKADIQEKKGVFIIEFKLAEKAKSEGYKVNEEDEI